MYTVGVVSLGCAKNRVDTELMLGILTQNGYELTANEAEADILIVNTCGFIDPAKQESVDTLLALAAYKKTGRLKLLVATGCLV
ncbi:MAG: 30S ribosomal protein S12 methylthiotransferase RimO, partial [Eubacteriales bacterium]|nr:30S ribosomal protein S12 methylthiotransferase RimO [Eubacteriales bacterium]